MAKTVVLLISAFFSAFTYAIPCFFTVAKDSCWTNYNVTVSLFDAGSNKLVGSILIPKGKSWARVQSNCSPGTTLRVQAQFNPIFWQGDENKIYAAQNYQILPSQIAKGETAWNITLCFPQQFAEVPFPPEGTANCQCVMQDIPAVKFP